MLMYTIGLPIVAAINIDVLVWLIKFNSVEHRIFDMQALINAFNNDPDLATIPSLSLPSVIQALFVCTGCDFFFFL